MNRFVPGAVSLVVICAAALLNAQTTIADAADYAKAMKTIGAAMGEANKFIAAGDTKEAKAKVAAARQAMGGVERFWTEHKKDEAAGLARASSTKLQALEQALGAITTNVATSGQFLAMKTAVTEAQGTCGACHAKYREQDPATKAFTFKAGVL